MCVIRKEHDGWRVSIEASHVDSTLTSLHEVNVISHAKSTIMCLRACNNGSQWKSGCRKPEVKPLPRHLAQSFFLLVGHHTSCILAKIVCVFALLVKLSQPWRANWSLLLQNLSIMSCLLSITFFHEVIRRQSYCDSSRIVVYAEGFGMQLATLFMSFILQSLDGALQPDSHATAPRAQKALWKYWATQSC